MSTLPSSPFTSGPESDFADDLHLLARIRRWPRYRRSILSLLTYIDGILSAERATGMLVIHYSQGHAAICEFREEARITDHD